METWSTFTVVLFTLLVCPAACAASPPSLGASIFATRPPDSRAIHANDAAFGLVGDGVADDTAALRRAINATYLHSRANCTADGHRIVFLGPGRYRMTGTVALPIWVRIIGYGKSRPTFVLKRNTPTFSNASLRKPLFVAIDWGRTIDPAFNASQTDGGNVAFGTGMMNVNFEVEHGNQGAVAVRNRVAQGGILRSVGFNLSDAFAAIDSPGWSHQSLVVIGGWTGVFIQHTGAWPSIYRDCSFYGQRRSAFTQHNDERVQGTWEGSTIIRSTFANAPFAFYVESLRNGGNATIRLLLKDCRWANLSSALVSLASTTALDNSVNIFDTAGTVAVDGGFTGDGTAGSSLAEGPVTALVEARDTGRIINPPANAKVAVVIHRLAMGVILRAPAQAAESRSQHGDRSRQGLSPSVSVEAEAVGTSPAMPASDLLPYPPVERWRCVLDAGTGVLGDGVHDDTAGLNALLQRASPGEAFYFPTGVYQVSDTIEVPGHVAMFGLSGDHQTTISLADDATGFRDARAPKAILHVLPSASSDSAAHLFVAGLGVRSATTYAKQPWKKAAGLPPAWNPNPGAISLLWQAQGGVMIDVIFHPQDFPDNYRQGYTGPDGGNTEVSMWVDGGHGVFADIWSCNSYADGGFWVTNSSGPGVAYQLSSEHHDGHELWIRNSSNWKVWAMQTEDRSPDSDSTCSVRVDASANVSVGGLFSYYAANRTSLAAIELGSGTVAFEAYNLRTYHSYHPLFYNCTVWVQGSRWCLNQTHDFADFLQKS